MRLFILVVLIKLVIGFEKRDDWCEVNEIDSIIGNIGGVFDESSRVGKEMKIASEMAVNDFYKSWACKYKLVLITTDSSGSTDQISTPVIELINNEQVNAIIGTVRLSVTDSAKLTRTIPTISILPTATSPSLHPQILHFSSNLITTSQCIAAIVGHFRWRKVIVIYQVSSDPSPLVAELAESLDLVDSVIERTHRIESVKAVEEVLRELRRTGNQVFVLLRGSLEFGKAVFGKAKELGMMEKGFVWIVSEDISSMVESLDAQFVGANMQGVIGFKTSYLESTEDYKRFRRGFRIRFGQTYPNEDEYSTPSLFALRAYDATMAISQAMKKLLGMNDSKDLLRIISSSKVKGLSGYISFKNGELSNPPTFQVINIVGKSYREIAFWSPSLGFSKDLARRKSTLTRPLSELGTIYWPGGLTRVPTGRSLGSEEKPLKVGVPVRGAFNQFVDQNKNGKYISGFSVDVFEAVVKQLPYHLSYVLVPFYGTYDDMIDAVMNKMLDAGVGDTQIMADRYEHIEFSQPYLESGLVMVVPVNHDNTKEAWMFVKAFKLEMWLLIPFMHVVTSAIVWFIESKEKNKDFEGLPSQKPADLLWFSFALVFFAQRESIKSNLSRIILACWLFVILIVASCFTSVLTSMLTVSKLQPSAINIEYLKNTNAVIGCNDNSFVAKYLINVLHFKTKNIREINSISDYLNAFKSGEIAAAFFVKPHAKVFVSNYCNDYTMLEPTFALGGFGIAFPRGSHLVTDISEAILKLIQSGEIQEMEKQMLSSSNCSSSFDPKGETRLSILPFSGLFIISGAISTIVFLIKLASLQSWPLPNVQETKIWAVISRWRMRDELGDSSSQPVQNPTIIELSSRHNTEETRIEEENQRAMNHIQ